MENIISLTSVSKDYELDNGETLKAIENVNLEIGKNEFFIILGPSGCGKSTLLRIMSGLDKNFKGELHFGKEVNSKDFSFVFQQFALLPWLSVYENISLGLIGRNVEKNIIKEKVNRELKRFRLEKFANDFPRELSGGMKQRVGIARALATDPKVIFMDEPFSELDSFTAADLRHDMLQIWVEEKPTIVMVTHLLEEAIELGDRIAVMNPRPGSVKNITDVKMERPRNKRSKDFWSLEDKLLKSVSP